MILPKHSTLHAKLLNLFLDFSFKNSFSKVEYINSQPLDVSKSVLLVGNHATWWDGFITWQINRFYLKKKFHLLMLENQLQKFGFFKHLGCFSIQPGNKSAIQSLQLCKNILRHSENLLVFYPQGRLYSLYSDEFFFQKGIEGVIKQNQNINIVFYASFFDYGSNAKPYLNVFFENYYGNSTVKELEAGFTEFYQRCKKTHLERFNP